MNPYAVALIAVLIGIAAIVTAEQPLRECKMVCWNEAHCEYQLEPTPATYKAYREAMAKPLR